MSTLDSILSILNKWPAWNRITQAPDRIDALEQRVIALETRLQRAPGEACPFCGELAFRLVEEREERGPMGLGASRQIYRCESCGKQRQVVGG